jgi:hypothetical protein
VEGFCRESDGARGGAGLTSAEWMGAREFWKGRKYGVLIVLLMLVGREVCRVFWKRGCGWWGGGRVRPLARGKRLRG